MALKKTLDFKGLEITNAYVKIAVVDIRDILVGETKTYKVNVTTSMYANSDKEAVIENNNFVLNVEAAEDLTYSKFYTELKAQPLLTGATNC